MTEAPVAEHLTQDDVNTLWAKWRVLAKRAVNPERKRLANDAWRRFCEADDLVNADDAPARVMAAPRYIVRTGMPRALRDLGLVAWIDDTRHPDDPEAGASCCFVQDVKDAERLCAALNRDEMYRARLRRLALEGAGA